MAEKEDTDFQKIIDVIFPPCEDLQVYKHERQTEFFEKNVLCSVEKAKSIFTDTTTQSASKDWFSERSVRISASVAHRFAQARTNETRVKYFLQKPFTCAALEYGITNEPVALKSYTNLTGVKIFPSGLVVSTKHPWLCGTPDGLFSLAEIGGGDGIGVLEIKCPYSCRDKPELDVPYLNCGQLKVNHQYYAQVQLQMYLCNAKLAHFFVFSPSDSQLIKIDRNDVFIDTLISKLEKIYFDVLLPLL